MNKSPIFILAALSLALGVDAQRSTATLNDGWEFAEGHAGEAKNWHQVRVPHDWAISGPFDISYDLQRVAVEQNGETKETLKTGRTGGLPFIGKGTYRTAFEVPDTAGRRITLVFDGAMSNAHVKVNGKEVAYWPYGYNSFYADVTGAVSPGTNDMVVELENFERASRWYPGAGLYRNVHVVNTDRVHIPVWGTYVTTPVVSKDYASVCIEMEIDGAHKGEKVNVVTDIVAPDGKVVASRSTPYVSHGQTYSQNFIVDKPELWSLESPSLYTARTRLYVADKEVDS